MLNKVYSYSYSYSILIIINNLNKRGGLLLLLAGEIYSLNIGLSASVFPLLAIYCFYIHLPAYEMYYLLQSGWLSCPT